MNTLGEVPDQPRYTRTDTPLRLEDRQRSRSVFYVVAAVVTIVVAGPLTFNALRDKTPAPTSQTAHADPTQGPPPELAYVDGGQVIIDGRSVASVSADALPVSTRGIDGEPIALIYDPTKGTVEFLGPDGTLEPVSGHVTSRPVLDQSGTRAAWTTDSQSGVDVVLALLDPTGATINDKQRIAEADLCCTHVVGIDQFARVFISDKTRTFVWDSDEGREGAEPQPPDSSNYLWRVSGLDGQQPVRSTANELVVRTVDQPPEGEHRFSWGTVPRNGRPYVHNGSLTATDVWFTRNDRLLSLDAEGRVHSHELATSTEADESGESWVRSTITGPPTAWNLPEGFVARHLVHESGGRTLVDGTFSDGARAWLRCTTIGRCEVATALSDDARLPE